MTTLPHDWIPTLPKKLEGLDHIPLSGGPAFPWEQFSKDFGTLFKKEKVTFKLESMQWQEIEKIYAHGIPPLSPLKFSFSNFSGAVWWVMPTQYLTILEGTLLNIESNTSLFIDVDLKEAFYSFIALEMLSLIQGYLAEANLAPCLLKDSSLPLQGGVFCLEVSCKIDQKDIRGHLLLSPEFTRSWSSYFIKNPPHTLNLGEKANVPVTLHLEIGHTNLLWKEWRALSIGDFLFLDKCLIDEIPLKGKVLITVHQKEVWRGRIKKEGIKLFKKPLYEEVSPTMLESPDAQNEDKLLSEEELAAIEKEIEENDLFKEDFSETPVAEGSAPLSSEKLSSIADLPFLIKVEIGQIEMPLERFLKLEEGNLLEIDTLNNESVILTLNGRAIGRGQLIRIGTTLGVRITNLGNSK